VFVCAYRTREIYNNDITTMPKPENIVEKGFDKRPENINKNGRPRLFVNTLILELEKQGIENVKPSQVVSIYEKLINLSIKELSDLANKEDAAWIIRQTAKQMLKNPEKAMQEILDRAHGKAKQSVDIDGTLGIQQITGMEIL